MKLSSYREASFRFWSCEKFQANDFLAGVRIGVSYSAVSVARGEISAVGHPNGFRRLSLGQNSYGYHLYRFRLKY